MKGTTSEDITRKRNTERDKNYGKPSEDPELLKEFKHHINENSTANENIGTGLKDSKRHGEGQNTGTSGELKDPSEVDLGKVHGHSHITRTGHLP
jgi:hypothetical protein